VTQFIVVEGMTEQFAQAAGDLVAVGWRLEPGWHPPAAPGVALEGAVEDRGSAEQAVAAAVAGAGLVVHGRAERGVLDALCGDLRHLGRLDHRVGRPVAVLSPEQRRLLTLLADGATIAEISGALHVSRRSADRRIAALRLVFGVDSVGAALATYRERLARLESPAAV
jgi:DNA-binding CsgD family transcriptional regulator